MSSRLFEFELDQSVEDRPAVGGRGDLPVTPPTIAEALRIAVKPSRRISLPSAIGRSERVWGASARRHETSEPDWIQDLTVSGLT